MMRSSVAVPVQDLGFDLKAWCALLPIDWSQITDGRLAWSRTARRARNINISRSEKRGCWRRRACGKQAKQLANKYIDGARLVRRPDLDRHEWRAAMYEARFALGTVVCAGPLSPRILKRRMMEERRRERGFSRGEAAMLGIYCERFSKTSKVRRRLGKFLRKYRRQLRNARKVFVMPKSATVTMLEQWSQ